MIPPINESNREDKQQNQTKTTSIINNEKLIIDFFSKKFNEKVKIASDKNKLNQMTSPKKNWNLFLLRLINWNPFLLTRD